MLFHTMKESVHLCGLFLWNGNIKSVPVVQVPRYILHIPNSSNRSTRFPGTYCIYQIPATVASSVHTSQPLCISHGFTPYIHSTDSHYIERRIFLFAPEGDETVGFPMSVRSTRCVCVNSLISLVRSRRARSHDNVSV